MYTAKQKQTQRYRRQASGYHWGEEVKRAKLGVWD